MTRFSHKQLLYINCFTAKSNQLVNTILGLEPDQNSSLHQIDQAANVLSTGIAAGGAIAAIPTLGGSLAITAGVLSTGAAIYCVAREMVGLITKKPIDTQVNTFTLEEQSLLLGLLMNEVAELLTLRYAFFIEQLIETPSMRAFAEYAAQNLTDQLELQLRANINTLLNDIKTGAFDTNALINQLMKSTRIFSTQSNEKKISIIPLNKNNKQTNIRASWAYSRTRIVAYILPNTLEPYQFTVYRSKHESVFYNTESSHKDYGYVLHHSLQTLQKELKLHGRDYVQESANDFFTTIKPYLSATHVVSREEIEKYRNRVQDKSGYSHSLNQFLSECYSIKIVAAYHGDELADLDLTGCNFSGVNFRHAKLRNCILNATIWQEAQLAFAEFTDCHLNSQSIFVSSGLEYTVWRNVEFQGIFTNANFTNAQWSNCRFTANWQTSGMNVVRLTIENPQLEESIIASQEKALAYLKNLVENSVQGWNEKQQSLQMDLINWYISEQQKLNDSYDKRLSAIENKSQSNFFKRIEERAEDLYEATITEPYVSLNVHSVRNGGGNDLPMKDKLSHFMGNPAEQLLLLLGEIGSGKSFSMARYQRQLHYDFTQGKSPWLPLLIHLKHVNRRTDGKYPEGILSTVLTNEDIIYLQEITSPMHIVLMLDGLDECPINLSLHPILQELIAYLQKNFKKLTFKIILTSETRFLYEQKQDYHQLLRPSEQQVEFPLTQEYVIRPLNEQQILEYLSKYYPDIQLDKTNPADKDMLVLAQSPIMLHIICRVLNSENFRHNLRSSRVHFYHEFLKDWFKHVCAKHEQEEYDIYTLESLEFYMMQLALDMFSEGQEYIQKQSGQAEEEPLQKDYTQRYNTQPMDVFFDEKKWKRVGIISPTVVERGWINTTQWIDTLKFKHRSFWFYALATRLMNSLQGYTHLVVSEPTKQLLSIWDSGYLVDIPGVFDFLKELVDEHLHKKQIHKVLCELVFYSDPAKNGQHVKAASNAMTLLNISGFDFSAHPEPGVWRNIQIPKANLRNALLAYVDLSNSNLYQVSFEDAVLIGTLMSEAQLNEARFSNTSSFRFARQAPNTFAIYPSTHPVIAYDVWTDNRHKIIMEDLSGTLYTQLTGHKSTINCLEMTIFEQQVRMASGAANGKIRVWESSKEGSEWIAWTYRMSSTSIVSLSWCPGGHLLAYANTNGLIEILDVNQKNSAFRFSFPTYSAAAFVAWGTHKTIFTFIRQGEIESYHYELDPINLQLKTFSTLRKELALMEEGEAPCSVVLSPDDNHLARGGTQGNINVFLNFLAERQDVLLKGHFSAVTSLIWNVHALISASRDSMVRVWDPQSLRCLAVYQGDPNGVTKLAWFTGGRRVIAGGGGRGHLFSMWNVERESNTSPTDAWLGFLGTQGVVAGSYLALDHFDSSVCLWPLDNLTAANYTKLFDHQGSSIRCLVWSRGGRYLASLSNKNDIKIYDVDTKNQTTIPAQAGVKYNHLVWIIDLQGSTCLIGVGSSEKLFIWKLIANQSTIELEEQQPLALRSGSGEIFCLEAAPATLTLRMAPTLEDITVLVQNPVIIPEQPIIGAAEYKCNDSNATVVTQKPTVWVVCANKLGIFLWNLREPLVMPTLKYPYSGEIKQLSWSPGGQFLACMDSQNSLFILDTWAQTWRVSFREDEPSSVSKCFVWASLKEQDSVQRYLIISTERSVKIYHLAETSFHLLTEPIKKLPCGGTRLVYEEPLLFLFYKKNIQVFNFKSIIFNKNAKHWVARLGEKQLNVMGLEVPGELQHDTLQLLVNHCAVKKEVTRQTQFKLSSFFTWPKPIARSSLPPISQENKSEDEDKKAESTLISSKMMYL